MKIIDNIDRLKRPLVVFTGLPTTFHAELFKFIISNNFMKRYFDLMKFNDITGFFGLFFKGIPEIYQGRLTQKQYVEISLDSNILIDVKIMDIFSKEIDRLVFKKQEIDLLVQGNKTAVLFVIEPEIALSIKEMRNKRFLDTIIVEVDIPQQVYKNHLASKANIENLDYLLRRFYIKFKTHKPDVYLNGEKIIKDFEKFVFNDFIKNKVY